MTGIPLYCERCSAMRAVEDWRETSPQTLTIALSPCGHEQQRTARLEWHRPARPARSPRTRAIAMWRPKPPRRYVPGLLIARAKASH